MVRPSNSNGDGDGLVLVALVEARGSMAENFAGSDFLSNSFAIVSLTTFAVLDRPAGLLSLRSSGHRRRVANEPS